MILFANADVSMFGDAGMALLHLFIDLMLKYGWFWKSVEVGRGHAMILFANADVSMFGDAGMALLHLIIDLLLKYGWFWKSAEVGWVHATELVLMVTNREFKNDSSPFAGFNVEFLDLRERPLQCFGSVRSNLLWAVCSVLALGFIGPAWGSFWGHAWGIFGALFGQFWTMRGQFFGLMLWDKMVILLITLVVELGILIPAH